MQSSFHVKKKCETTMVSYTSSSFYSVDFFFFTFSFGQFSASRIPAGVAARRSETYIQNGFSVAECWSLKQTRRTLTKLHTECMVPPKDGIKSDNSNFIVN
jgi:hypothetical protein